MRLTFTACVRGVFLLVPLFLCTILLANDAQHGEKITLSEKAVPLKVVFKKITLQTGIKFVYSNRLVDDEQKVNVSVKDADLEEVMEQIFVGKRFELQRTSPKSVVLIVHEKTIETKVEPVAKKNAGSAFFDVTGIVTDTVGGAIPGATVMVRGTNKATATNGEGRFFLQDVKQDMVLLVSSIGFQTRQIKIGNQDDLSIRLSMAVNNLDESVITAYGSTTQRDNVGAITTIKGEEIRTLPSRSFDKSLQGLVPGLWITKGTGQPGGGISNMVIRGIATGGDVSTGSTARNPLIVIDGIPVTQDYFQFTAAANATPISNPLAQINPSDIETISVLKDAAAIALYGSKASNGVLLVTTKRGKTGKTVFGFRHQTDISTQLDGELEFTNQQEYLQLLSETFANTNPYYKDPQRVTDTLKKIFPVRADGSFYPAPNWNKALYSDRAVTSTNEISMSGGNEKSNFYLNLEYSKQNGVVKETGYDRKSMRFNFEHRPALWLKLGVSSAFSYNTQDYTNAAASASDYATGMILSPLNPVTLENGDYMYVYSQGGISSIAFNPVASALYNFNKTTAYRGLGKIFGEARFLKYFTFTTAVGIDFMLAELRRKHDPRLFTASTPALIAEKSTRRNTVINTNTLRFDKAISSDHVLNVTLGHEAQINNEKTLSAEATGNAQTAPYYNQLSSPGYTMSEISGGSNKQTLLSLFAQANYTLRKKYLLSSSIRGDGSSKFGDRQQWGTYWSIGAGWIVTEEKFVKDALPWLNYLKFRGSVGAAGNSAALDQFVRFDKLNRVKYQNEFAVIPLQPGNPDIRWEQTFSSDLGMEARFLQNRISITADIYSRKTQDLIYTTTLPSQSGFGSYLDNIGNMNNKGVELSLSAAIIRSKEFRWNLRSNWSTNKNILVKANVPLATISGGVAGNEEGRNFNSFYMPVWAGVNPADGKPQWLDETGKSTSTYSLAKKQFVGKPQPDGIGGINNSFGYKGFNLSADFYYQYGVSIYNSSMTTLMSDGIYPFINQIRQSLDYWKKPGDMAGNPRRLINNTDKSNSASTRFLFKGDYVRLSNVTLSYNFPRNMLSNIYLSSLNVYVQGNNLAIFTLYPGPDPDNASVGGTTGFAYPNQRSFSVGLNAGF